MGAGRHVHAHAEGGIGPVSIPTFDTFQRTPAQTKPTATREQLCFESAQLL
jgi:hypothetical protein